MLSAVVLTPDFKTDREGSMSDKAEDSAGTRLYRKCRCHSRQYETTWMRFSTLTVSALDIKKCCRPLVFIQEAQKDMGARRAYTSDTFWRWMITQKTLQGKVKVTFGSSKSSENVVFPLLIIRACKEITKAVLQLKVSSLENIYVSLEACGSLPPTITHISDMLDIWRQDAV